VVRAAALSEVPVQEGVAATIEEGKQGDALQYKPNIENMMVDEASESDDEKPQYSDSDSEAEKAPSKGKPAVFKAAKLNPLAFEDKETKKKRREEMIQKTKAGRSDYVNELRREIYDLPEEVHMGGMTSQRTRFTKEQEQIERMEQDNFKRMNFTKKELKDQRNRQQNEMHDSRLDKLDDLRGLESLIGTQSKQRGRD
jgi:hypothetical protein